MELVERLKEKLGVTRGQAAGGAGLLLHLAQERLTSEEFVQVADTAPAISDIIGKAPRCNTLAISRLRVMVSRRFGGLGELTPLVVPFGKLGLDKAMLRRFSCELLKFFREKGGVKIHEMLQSVWR